MHGIINFPRLLKEYLFLLFFSLINSSFSLSCKTLVFMKFLISFGSPSRTTWVTRRGLSLILGSFPPVHTLDAGGPLCSVPGDLKFPLKSDSDHHIKKETRPSHPLSSTLSCHLSPSQMIERGYGLPLDFYLGY